VVRNATEMYVRDPGASVHTWLLPSHALGGAIHGKRIHPDYRHLADKLVAGRSSVPDGGRPGLAQPPLGRVTQEARMSRS
jgi:hypothetical protein